MTAPGPTQQDLPLDGKAALVTGGGSGIGLETARVLRADGATVTICGRTEERLREAAEEVNGDGSGRPDLRWCVADARDEAAVEAAVAAASEPLGGLHLAVASAGRGGLGPIIATPLEEWEDILATNLTGTFLLFKHAGAAIARSGGGSMVAISSIAAAVTHPFMGPYCVSKAGVNMMTRCLALELAPDLVRVNAVCPSDVATPFLYGQAEKYGGDDPQGYLAALREVRPGHHVACHHAETLELKGIHDLPKAGALST